MRPNWQPDLLPGFVQFSLPLPDVVAAAGEQSDEFVATVVRPVQPVDGEVAVISLPGWNDYFFHAHVAEFFTGLGLGFYAVDPRRSGRSWREGQYRSYVEDVDDFAAEIDGAIAAARSDGYTRFVLYGHSTGGLAAALYADRDDREVAALILNSPFLALPGPRTVTKRALPVIRRVAARHPERLFPGIDAGLYGRALNRTLGGEWDYDLAFKPSPADPLHYGWLQAVTRAQALVARGLHVRCPILTLTAARSSIRATWDESCRTSDIVLDQKRCGAAATQLGPRVTVIRIHDGVHDLALSVPDARASFFAEIERWLAYVGVAD